jgi:hypothetical protein
MNFADCTSVTKETPAENRPGVGIIITSHAGCGYSGGRWATNIKKILWIVHSKQHMGCSFNKNWEQTEQKHVNQQKKVPSGKQTVCY